MKSLKNQVVAITGASSGIGRALAVKLAKDGARLALSDINEPALAETVSLCEGHGAQVHSQILDVSKRSEVAKWADAVNAHFGQVNVIINNAGVNLNACVEKMTYKDFEWVMDIDFWGVVYGTKAFLPHIKASGWGQVVNISSLFGLIGIPNQSAYNAAKFAVRGFSESLRMELEIEGCNVGVTSVHPGGVKTNIVNDSRMRESLGRQVSEQKAKDFFNNHLAKTTPEEAADDIINGILKNAPRVLVGPDARMLDKVQRLMPTTYQKLVMRASK